MSLVNRALPPNINLLTLEPWDGHRLLVRFEHFYGVGEDDTYSKPVTISLKVFVLKKNIVRIRIHQI